MTFRVGIGSTHIASFSANGAPYLWQTGDVTTLPSVVGIITSSDGAAYDQFGFSVAAGCGKVVVGAWANDHSGSGSGSAYIFDLDGNQLGIITASDAAASAFFGGSVAVGSGKIVVGAFAADVGSNADQGAAYIYDLDGNQLGIITASDGAAYDNFGWSVAVGSGRIVVGANRDSDNGYLSGSAYIFDLDGNQLDKITASDGAAGDDYGFSVAAGSGRIVVSGRYHNIGSNANQGAVYIYDLNGNEVGIITGSDGAASDLFGYSVAVGSGRIIVGAGNDDVNGNADQGSAYIFDLDGIELKKITASDGAASDFFGRSVAVGSGRVVVGAYGNNVGSNVDQGSAYIYDLDGNQLGIITASDGALHDQFGYRVAVGSGRIVVGAYKDDVGIGGTDQGSAYIYKTPDVITVHDVADWNSY